MPTGILMVMWLKWVVTNQEPRKTIGNVKRIMDAIFFQIQDGGGCFRSIYGCASLLRVQIYTPRQARIERAC